MVLSVLGILCFVGIVPIGLMGYQVAHEMAQDLSGNQKEAQLDRATIVANEITRYVDDHYARLGVMSEALAHLPTAAADAEAGSEAQVRDFLGRFVGPQWGVLELRLVPAAPDGQVVRVHAQSFDPEVIAAELEPAVAEAIEPGRRGSRHLSNPFLPEARPLHPLAVMAVPLRGGVLPGGGNVAHPVLVALVSMSPIQALVQRVSSSEDGYTVYVLDDGPARAPFAHTQFTKVVERADLGESPLVQEFLRYGLSAQVKEFEEPALDGGTHHMIGTYVPVPLSVDQHRWGVFVQVDRAEGFFQVRKLWETTLRWGILAFVLATVIGVVFSWRITGPIHRLTESTRRVAGGEYGRRVAIKANNELGMLADHFNVMSEEIRHTIEDLSHQKELNDQLFISSIRSLAAAIDARDPYTRGHSERVRRFARIIARQLGLGPEQIRNIEIGALLHDVGKIGIEDRILRKPSALTPEEFEIMKTHPEKGGDIMEPISFLREAAEIIIHHHERWDGTGYPSGLKGEDIPLGARIVNVADTFDAMTTNRPYQRAMTFTTAARKIGDFAGKACDPRVVRAFQAGMDAGLFGQVPSEASRAS